jgi:hypothetical protein
MFSELLLLEGEQKTLQIVFSPTENEKRYVGALKLLNLDMYPGQTNPESFASIQLEGTGGNFAFRAVESEDAADITEDDEPAEVLKPGETPSIKVNFPKVIVGQRVKKVFDIENCGDTIVDVAITDSNGIEVQSDVEVSVDKVMYKLSPGLTKINPKTKARFSVILKGLREGEDTFPLQVSTRSLTVAKVIPVKITAKVISPDSLLGDGLRAFARADNSIDATLSCMAQEEGKYDAERDLWKVILPVIRVSALLPSQDLKYIPFAQPKTDLPDIAPFVVRPPAIPRDVAQRAKKWYMNRGSLQLDQIKVM